MIHLFYCRMCASAFLTLSRPDYVDALCSGCRKVMRR